jgi:DNA-binding NtrC family response regulator
MSASSQSATAVAKSLLSVIELGGYPDFSPLYRRAGFTVTTVNTARKAIAAVKKAPPAVIVAEFNYQSDFRDRTSSLESLLAAAERHAGIKVIVFYEKESRHQLDKLLAQFSVFATLAYPIAEQALEAELRRTLEA